MPIDIRMWMYEFTKLANQTFGPRIRLIGLQGSYARREASENSDIDVVLILDTLSLSDLERYRAMLDRLPHRQLVCGFVSGAKELSLWEPSDRFQFYHDTEPLQGRLEDLFPPASKEDARCAVWSGACSIYHGVCHNFVHERSVNVLESLYKSARFVLQAKLFYETNTYYVHKYGLARVLSPQDLDILNGSDKIRKLPDSQDPGFSTLFDALMQWSGHLIKQFYRSSRR